jgi:hypothetical protein
VVPVPPPDVIVMVKVSGVAVSAILSSRINTSKLTVAPPGTVKGASVLVV